MKSTNCVFAIVVLAVLTTTDLFGHLDVTRMTTTMATAAAVNIDDSPRQESGRAFRIKPKPCWDKKGREGTCMFQWECHRRSGLMLATCVDRFLFGTCCYISSNELNSTETLSVNVTTTTTTVTPPDVTTETANDWGDPNFIFTPEQTQSSTVAVVNFVSKPSSPIELPTPNIDKIFHQFLGSVLANYSNSFGTYPSTQPVFDRNNDSVTTTVATTTGYVHLDVTNVTDYDDYHYEEIDETTVANGASTSSNVTVSYPILLGNTTSVSVTLVETIVPSPILNLTETSTATISTVNDLEIDLNVYDDSVTGDADMYSDIKDDPVPSTISAVTTTTTTSATTTTTPTTTTIPTTTRRHFDYKKVFQRFFLMSSYSPWTWPLSVLAALLPTIVAKFISNGAICDLPMSLCKRVSSVEQTFNDGHRFQIPERSANEDYCGIRPLVPNGRIVGGTGSRFGEWPWQVLIKEATWLGLFVKNKCGGVLLNHRYVITAAHCQPSFLASLLVIFGESDLNVANEDLKPMQRNVRRVVVHRKFNALTFDNDLALLELDRPVEYKPHVVPVCLPSDNMDLTDQVAIVSGWGRLKYGGRLPSGLQHVEVPIIPNRKCQQMFLSAGHIKGLGDKFICAGYQDGGKDSCEGDSGGPLMLEGDDGRWILIGTVSHGIKCAYPNLPGVYINIAAYKSWIQKVIDS